MAADRVMAKGFRLDYVAEMAGPVPPICMIKHRVYIMLNQSIFVHIIAFWFPDATHREANMELLLFPPCTIVWYCCGPTP